MFNFLIDDFYSNEFTSKLGTRILATVFLRKKSWNVPEIFPIYKKKKIFRFFKKPNIPVSKNFQPA